MSIQRLLLSVTVLLFCLIGHDAAADEGNLYQVALQEKVDSSSLIIRGTVIKSEASWDAPGHMIYTTHTVRVYTVYKGSVFSETVSIRTAGGRVGNEMVTTSSLLTLEPGDAGIFFCTLSDSEAGYEVYASKQGFLAFAGGKAVCPFYSAGIKATEEAVVTLTNQYDVLQPLEPEIPPVTASLTGPIAFSPAIVTAGTNSLLTITGSGFGTSGPDSDNHVAFSNADNGGAAFIVQAPDSYVSWTDDTIVLYVPSQAGTGPIKVTVDSVGHITTGILTVPFAIMNTGLHAIPRLINQGGTGGTRWTFNSNMNFAGGAAAPFNRARDTWRCATGGNWTVSSSATSIDDPIAGDGMNVVARNDVAAGVLGVCYNYFTSCNGDDWNLYGQDIIFKEYWFGGGSWNYSTAAPFGNEYDFESVALHELGHAHLLGHVIDGDDVLHYAIANAQMRRTLTFGNVTAGNYVMDLSTTGATCGTSPMVLAFPAGCSQTPLTDVWLVEPSVPLDNTTCFGPQDIRVSFANYGFDTITAIAFGWSLNGTPQSSFSWTGSLAFNAVFDDLLIDSYDFQDSVYTIRIWANSVNGLQEVNRDNDTIVFTFHPVPCTPDNAAIGAIGNLDINACVSVQPIAADLINAGTNPLTSCLLITEANGLPVDTLSWTGNLLPGDTLHDLVVTTFGDFHPSVVLRIRTVLPNGVPDTYAHNDTVTATFFPNRLLGTYTVGGNAPDFVTLNEVFEHLDTYGVCGDVTFNIRSGTYPVDVYVDSIPADNMAYNIVFQSESGNAADVNITEETQIATFVLNRAHNLTFRNLGFTAFSPADEWKLVTVYGTQYQTWENNHFNNVTLWIEPNTQNRTCDHVRIDGNTFVGSSIVAYNNPFYDSIASDITITNNTIGEPGGRIEVAHYKNIRIDHNRVWQSHYGLYYQSGIDVEYKTDSLTISHNIVEKYSDGGSALKVIHYTSPATGPVRIFNNQLTQQPGETEVLTYAVQLFGMPLLEFHHNTVWIDDPTATPTSSYVFEISHIDSAVLYNNQLIHSGPGSIFRFYDQPVIYTDYNNYHTTGSFSYSWENGTQTDLADFAATYGYDTHSTFIAPQFAAADYLVPINFQEMDNLGTPIGYIGTDILGTNRNPLTPDVGAYEFHSFAYDLQLRDTSNLENMTFCQGNGTELLLTAFNNGTETIDSFVVYVELDGIPADTVVINETILPQQSLTFSAGSYVFTNPFTTVEVICAQPNGMTDSMSYNNDYAYTFHTQLGGTYTVGPAPSDFATIQQALENLSYGLCGPVVFNLKDGFHDDWGTIGHIPNNNSVNTITFQSLSGDTSTTIISAGQASTALRLDGPQYISFRNLQFAPHGTHTYPDITIDSAAMVLFDSCLFAHTSITNTYPNVLNGLTAENSRFLSSQLTFQSRATNIMIHDNVVEGASALFFQGYGQGYEPTDFRIYGNRFDNITGTPYDALIEIVACREFEIYRNDIHCDIPVFEINNCGNHTIIKNNFVRSDTHDFSYFSGNTDMHIVHNSFSNTGFFFVSDNPYLEFKNNIVSNPGTSPTFHFTYQSQLDYPISDYNLFYGNTNNFASYISGTPLTFIVWRNTYGDDVNSQVGDPAFISATDLHTSSPLAASNGLFLPYAFDDIDGETRDLTSPDIGADEFGFNSSLLFDIALDSIIAPLNSLCDTGFMLTVQVTNNSSTDLTGAHFVWATNTTNNFYFDLDWTGLIAPGASEVITVGSLALMSGFPDVIYVSVTAPNGGTDTNSTDNHLNAPYTYYEGIEIVTGQPFVCGSGSTEVFASLSDGDLLWSNGSTQPVVTLSAPGTYWLQLTTPYGCVLSDTIEITGYPAPVPVLISAADSAFCDGLSTLLTPDPVISGNTYVWSTGSTAPSISVNAPGMITLTTTDVNGCTTTDQQQIVVLSGTYADMYLASDFLLVSQGWGEVSYQWLLDGTPVPGATNNTYSVQEDGFYSLETTSASGCSSTSFSMYVDYSGAGLNDAVLAGMIVYPNPSEGYFSVSFTEVPTIDIVLLDMSGRTVMTVSQVAANQPISITELQAGTYTVLVNGHQNIPVLLVKL